MSGIKNIFSRIGPWVRLAIIAVICLLSWRVSAQTYAVGHTSITFKDPNRSNRSIPCEIYYPASSAGDNTPVSTDRKFPSIAFGHGFLMTWDAYKNVWNALVPQGFVVIFPKTEGSASPSHSEFGSDLVFALSALETEGKSVSSMFYGRIDTLNCVMGHSMGGGAAFLAASQSSNIDFIATLAPAETNPKATTAATSLTIPSIIIAGGNDCVTPPKDHQIPMFDSLKSNCKHLVTVTGGSHCQMAEDNFLCNFGEATCSPKASISRSEQHQIQFRFLIPWLKYYLLNDAAAGRVFDSLVSKSTGVQTRKNCLLNPGNGSNGTDGFRNLTTVEISPNPAVDFIRIASKNPKSIAGCDLLSLDGKLLQHWEFLDSGENENGLQLELKDGVMPGIYLLRLQCEGNFVFQRMQIVD